jgi:hypothetical protein
MEFFLDENSDSVSFQSFLFYYVFCFESNVLLYVWLYFLYFIQLCPLTSYPSDPPFGHLVIMHKIFIVARDHLSHQSSSHLTREEYTYVLFAYFAVCNVQFSSYMFTSLLIKELVI